MKEIFGDMWAYYDRTGFMICVTTNGYVKTNGEGVMGAGCAKQALQYEPNLPKLLGKSIRTRGNVVSLLTSQILSFPVKHNWWEKADTALIRQSAEELKRRAEASDQKFILPRPGCGNGKLIWLEVQPLLADLPDNVWVIGNWDERP